MCSRLSGAGTSGVARQRHPVRRMVARVCWSRAWGALAAACSRGTTAAPLALTLAASRWHGHTWVAQSRDRGTHPSAADRDQQAWLRSSKAARVGGGVGSKALSTRPSLAPAVPTRPAPACAHPRSVPKRPGSAVAGAPHPWLGSSARDSSARVPLSAVVPAGLDAPPDVAAAKPGSPCWRSVSVGRSLSACRARAASSSWPPSSATSAGASSAPGHAAVGERPGEDADRSGDPTAPRRRPRQPATAARAARSRDPAPAAPGRRSRRCPGRPRGPDAAHGPRGPGPSRRGPPCCSRAAG